MGKRYLLFAWPFEQEAGGWDDLVESFDELEAAKNYIPNALRRDRYLGLDEWHVIDTTTGEKVAEGQS